MRRFGPRTLRQRIVAATALVSTVGVAALVALALLAVDRSTDREMTTALDDRIAAVLATTSVRGGTLTVANANDALFDTLTWVYDTSGRKVEGPTVPAALRPAVAEMATRTVRTSAEQGPWRLAAAPIRAQHRRAGTTVVALNTTPYTSVLGRTAAASVLIGLTVVLVGTAIASVIVRRALRPVAAMAATADAWSQERLDERFALGPPRDEITGLGAVLDRLLERVRGSIEAEQRLTAELAHELRTPLTVVQAEAELGLGDGTPPAARARFQRIAAAAADMSGAITTILDAARGAPLMSARSDVGVAVRRMVARSARSGIRQRVDAAGAVPIPDELLDRILGPVVENAFRYARSTVEAVAARDDDVVQILIRNDGPPVTGIEHLFEPGVREAASPGAGLGLALARRLARTAGGDVRLQSAEPAAFLVELPVEQRSPAR